MIHGNRCTGGPPKPSGHSEPVHPPLWNAMPTNGPAFPSHFSGPFNDFKPPGSREPVVGEHVWGDVPYLPSYLDPMNPAQTRAAGPADNLYTRGPFFTGVSETHHEFVNRGGIEPRVYHDYIRHYEEPGMKNDKSITYTDFGPPHPMLPGDKAPCLRQTVGEPDYRPKLEPMKNPHAKEYEGRSAEPQLVYVEEGPKREFRTETSDNYVCYQKPREKNQLMNALQPKREVFLDRLLNTHENCPYGLPYEFLCGDAFSKKENKPCKNRDCQTLERKPWLLHPKNYSFPNGFLILPSKYHPSQYGHH